jgi:stage III sporulation protein AB
VKWIALTVIASSLIGLSFGKAKKLQQRMKDLKSVLLMLELLKGEIGYAIAPMEDAFMEIAKRMTTPFSDFFHALSQELKQLSGESLEDIWTRNIPIFLEKTALVESDLTILKKLGGKLGCLDEQTQIRILDYTREEVLRVIETLNQNLQVNIKLYQSMGIIGAVFIFVIAI